MKALRVALIVLELVVAVNAVGGGIYGLAGAKDVPLELLRGSPFQSYVVPSIVLLVAVGGSMLGAAALLLRRHRLGPPASVGAGLVLAGWIGVQVAIIGVISWLQPAMLAAALAAIGLGVALRHEAAGRVSCRS